MSMGEQTVTVVHDEPKHAVVEEPPALTPRQLLRENLFKDTKNSVLTLVFGGLLLYALFAAARYVFVTARWEIVFDGPLVVYMLGNRFGETGTPFALVWAGVYAAMLAGGFAIGLARDPDAPPMTRRTQAGILLPPVLGVGAVLAMTRTITPTLLTLGAVAVMLGGRWLVPRLPGVLRSRLGLTALALLVLSFLLLTGFQPTNVNDFGGLLLTVTVSFAAIVLSFPIGIVMALARRSSFPLIRPLAVAYIELIRGVPLISLLFIGQFALGFLFPPGTAVPGAIPRAIIMITLFTGAYVAEVVRGGLQSVPPGQTEAGQAVGLSPLKITRLIVLPQALRNSIPALIGQFISLIKDTSLLAIVGILEILAVTEPILASLEFSNQGYTPEAYAFVGFIYFVICFSMSRASQRLETRLGVGTR